MIMFNQSVSLLGFDNGLKIAEGTINLKIGASKIGRAPNPRHNKCSSLESGTVLKDCPPNSTQAT